jgi:glycosyltransferase involved in cell wall biosynthesis
MLSVVTINFNNKIGLFSTLSSLNSINKIIEFIVIDNNSTDGSLELLAENSKLIKKLISEKDYGIYNAMNKGIHMCTNEYIIFLNSGDSFYNSSNFSQLSSNIGLEDLIYGDILDSGQNPLKVVTYPDNISFEYMLCGGLPHQATAIRKSLFEKVGYYNEKYKIISDWVFFMEALFIHKVTYRHLPIVISNFEGGGVSSNSANTAMIVYEQLDYITKRFPDSLKYYFTHSPYVKKYLRQKSRVIRWFYKLILIKFNKVL